MNLKKIDRYLKPDTLLVMIDVDNFKNYNTRFGYEKADRLLAMLTARIRKHLSDSALIIRYKLGDEFIIVIPKVCAGSEDMVISELRRSAEEDQFMIDQSGIRLTLSISCTFYNHNDSKNSMIERLVEDINNTKRAKSLF